LLVMDGSAWGRSAPQSIASRLGMVPTPKWTIWPERGCVEMLPTGQWLKHSCNMNAVYSTTTCENIFSDTNTLIWYGSIWRDQAADLQQEISHLAASCFQIMLFFFLFIYVFLFWNLNNFKFWIKSSQPV
jgi:hypothetical protein